MTYEKVFFCQTAFFISDGGIFVFVFAGICGPKRRQKGWHLLNYRNWFYAVILFHELNHQFGAPDHYHEEDKYHNCINPLYCSTCGSQKRPEECVMNGSTNLNELCDGCKNDILTHLRIYNFVD